MADLDELSDIEEDVEEEDVEDAEAEFEDLIEAEGLSEHGYRELVGEERRSQPYLGSFAKARLIATRAKQLELGYPPAIPRERLKSIEPQRIARQEIEEKVIPLKIIRKFPDGTYEIWNIKDFKYVARD